MAHNRECVLSSLCTKVSDDLPSDIGKKEGEGGRRREKEGERGRRREKEGEEQREMRSLVMRSLVTGLL